MSIDPVYLAVALVALLTLRRRPALSIATGCATSLVAAHLLAPPPGESAWAALVGCGLVLIFIGVGIGFQRYLSIKAQDTAEAGDLVPRSNSEADLPAPVTLAVSQPREHVEAIAQIERAIENDEFEPHFQPQVSVTSGCIVGVEALARWQPEGRNEIPPASFVGIAEESGLISAIGERILAKSCRQLKQWIDDDNLPLRLAVNVSSHQLRTGSILPAVAKTLHETGIPPRLLKLELTESALMSPDESVVDMMNWLHDLEVALAIDDFGTGYSSLSYLSRFPVETLKVDRSFVRSMTEDPANASIVDAIIELAHILGMTVVAEGVDDPEQLTFLRAYRCDEAQGFLFSKAVPGDRIPSLLQRFNALSPISTAA